MNNQKLQEKLAWQTAYQLRVCPDDALLFSGKARKTPTMAAHLAICTFCNERMELSKDERSAIADFSLQINKRLQQPVKSEPKAGQIWTLAAKSAGWGSRNRHYNPPRVLLLKAIEGSKGFIASQLFSEKALMGQGDVWLKDSFGFAESWNTYSVHSDMLEICWGEVSNSLLTDVCRAADKDWDSSLEGSLLQSFRQIEVSVASFFSMQAVAQLAEEYEAAPELSVVLEGALQKVKAFVIDLKLGDLDFLGQVHAMPALARGTDSPKSPSSLIPLFGATVSTGTPVSAAGGTAASDNLRPIGSDDDVYETTSKIASLKDDEAIKLLPIDHGQFKGDRYKLKFRDLSWLSEEPLPVRVAVRGVLVENVQWEQWGTEDTWLVLHDTVISEEEKQADRTFLSISWNERCLNVQIYP